MTCRLKIFIAYLIFPTFCAAIPDLGEVENEFEFNYMLRSNEGPQHWGHLNPNWKTCANGKLQSPIDLNEDIIVVSPKLGGLKTTYKPARARAINRGHDIMVSWQGDAGAIEINSTKYKLVQCHWHTPSEHTVDGKRFSMEIHLLHESIDRNLSVIGILYKLGRPDPFLEKVLRYINGTKYEGLKDVEHKGMDIGVVDPREVKLSGKKYFRYMGSLTVPPCTEGVLWTILKKVRTVSRKQIRALREVVHDGFMYNVRPTQRST